MSYNDKAVCTIILSGHFRVKMIVLTFLLFLLLCCGRALSQPDEAFHDFDCALKYRDVVSEFTFDSTWREIPMSILSLSALKTVIFNRSEISRIPEEVYSLPKLEQIVLIGTNFLDISAFLESISKSSISVVVIQEVELRKLPKLHSPANRLKELHLIDVGLESLTEGFADFPNLEYLSIVGNREVAFGTDEGLANLKILDLSRSQWQALPVSVSSIPNLEALIITDNLRLNVDSLINQLNEKVRLKTLNLDRCGAVEIPAALCQQQLIELLSMRGNSIASLPPCIASMNKLTSVNFSSNKLSKFPEDLLAVKGLRYMSVSFNNIHSVQISDLPDNLIHLFLEGNPIDNDSLKLLKEMPFWVDVIR